jgi:RNA polymerase sigma factor (TIGR02999 family)
VVLVWDANAPLRKVGVPFGFLVGGPVKDVTQILQVLGRGDANAANELLHLVYNELRQLASQRMAQEQPGQTLQPTALVHEAWLRLGGNDQRTWQNRAHFFGAAAEAMRRILIERARQKQTVKNGGDRQRLQLPESRLAAPEDDEHLLAVHAALDKLASHDCGKAELVMLRYFAGMTIAEAAQVLGISERTAKRHWTYARAWLYHEIQSS